MADIVKSCVNTCIVRVLTAPLDNIQLIKQIGWLLQDSGGHTLASLSASSIAYDIVTNEGYTGLFRGALVTILHMCTLTFIHGMTDAILPQGLGVLGTGLNTIINVPFYVLYDALVVNRQAKLSYRFFIENGIPRLYIAVFALVLHQACVRWATQLIVWVKGKVSGRGRRETPGSNMYKFAHLLASLLCYPINTVMHVQMLAGVGVQDALVPLNKRGFWRGYMGGWGVYAVKIIVGIFIKKLIQL
eukprot:TRINITY_DN8503_c0_g1_i1.p1 TRINITY_DN8503_c0_g1~~TRINITY_DN8503_c0_g1_i1.p1  ORF type:complete len:245 (+),score=13.13 TRINITY_DN8503_c0_g1_i1:54-788(+)